MPDDHKQPIEPTVIRSGRGPRIAILGAGFAGMGMAIRLRQEGFDNFTIYEKAEDVGGTWRENTYPGVACDVPSHLYSFSFEANPNWSKRYSPGPEILAYLRHCARKYDLYRSIEFGKTVKAARHDGAVWHVEFADGETVIADFVISGLGGLHKPSFPDIEGLNDFDGPVFHTAQWRDDVDLTGKRVAIIGSAASAVQVVPEIVPQVAHLDVYQRTANWVMARNSYAYPGWLQALFRKMPFLARLYRGHYFKMAEWRFDLFKNRDSRIKRMSQKLFTRHMTAQVPDPDLRKKLTPNYPIGCKRILISDDYLPAIQRENVDLITEGIDQVTKTGLRTKDGQARDVDVIILATGFKPFDILESIDVIGPAGTSLKDYWAEGVRAHRTIAVPGFPNFFLLLGPNSGLGHNSVVLMIEAQVNYILKLMGGIADPERHLIEPSDEAMKKFDQRLQRELGNRVWSANCGAWYVDASGRNYTLYPDSVTDYLREMRSPDLGEYKISEKELILAN
ncbi:NAD(P)/FAD-dependent oxidoreductase [Hyphococcus formosus]|uniref:flavin-containing monooxygenase n=1 Tax=Hyphococcus formosus TaxID=3143534 RepID=UPI00398A70B7